MYIRYGAYTSVLNEAGVATQRRAVRSFTGGVAYYEETWTISGFLQAPDPYTLTALANILDAAFSTNNQDLSLIANDGLTVLRGLAGITPVGGTEVVGGVSYPEDGRADAEYSTYRRYVVQVKGCFAPLGTPPYLLLSYTETLTMQGTGGPRFVHLQPLQGPPVKQYVAEATVARAVQEGSAVALGAYYPIPFPLFPDAEKEDERVQKYGSPKRSGGAFANVLTEWPCEWRYSYEDGGGALLGLPDVPLGL